MSKSNPSTTNKSKLVALRIPNETFAKIEAILARSVIQTPGEPYNMTSWILKAIKEKLDHLGRRGKRKIKRSAKPDDDIELPDPGEVHAENTTAA